MTANETAVEQEVFMPAAGTARLPEHAGIEIVGNDGKTHQIWADSAKSAYEGAAKWAYRHGGLADVFLMILRDDKKGCWERALRVPFGRQCSLPIIMEKHAQAA